MAYEQVTVNKSLITYYNCQSHVVNGGCNIWKSYNVTAAYNLKLLTYHDFYCLKSIKTAIKLD